MRKFTLFLHRNSSPGGGIGRRAGFKIQFWQQSAGSIPAPGTKERYLAQVSLFFLRLCTL